ncbi:putative DNA-directed RNA polymerase [Halotydeus destructor]|nr:putative DNA-directed RNA polymerase [Halotydeus destructor]
MLNKLFTKTEDLIPGCLLVLGAPKLFPVYISNDSANFHTSAVAGTPSIRKFVYSDSIGYKLEFEGNNLTVTNNKGSTTEVSDDEHEIRKLLDMEYGTPTELAFKHYMSLELDKLPDVDHFGNKLGYELGEFLLMIFEQDIVPALRNWIQFPGTTFPHSLIAQAAKGVISGKKYFHCLSLRTRYGIESAVNCQKQKYSGGIKQSQYGQRRLSERTGQAYCERTSCVFQDVALTNYQLVPFLVSNAKRVLSDKVKDGKALAWHQSCLGFLCPLSTSETKNTGRSLLLCQDVISTIWSAGTIACVINHIVRRFCSIEPQEADRDALFHLIVVNYVPFRVTRQNFENFEASLVQLKREFKKVECFTESRGSTRLGYFRIRNAMFMRFTPLPNGQSVWSSPNEFNFWFCHQSTKPFLRLVDEHPFSFFSSALAVFVPKSKHNIAQKGILALNNLRNAILNDDQEILNVFCEPQCLTQRLPPSIAYEFFNPVDRVSSRFQVRFAKLKVQSNWQQGLNEEDAFVLNRNSSFVKQSYVTKHLSLRYMITLQVPAAEVDSPHIKFQQVTSLGNQCDGTLPMVLGRVYEVHGAPIQCVSSSSGASVRKKNENTFYLEFNRPGYCCHGPASLSYEASLKAYVLLLQIQKTSKIATGDKICSLAGQKGIVKLIDSSSIARTLNSEGEVENDVIDIVMHSDSVIRRQTIGQMLEFGEPRTSWIRASDGQLHPILVFDALFMQVAFRATDNIYMARTCAYDVVLGQPAKGSSRGGGVKQGTMEIRNCYVGNSLSFASKRMLYENSDVTFNDGCRCTRGYEICNDDATYMGCTYKLNKRKCIQFTAKTDLLGAVPLKYV